MSEPDDTRKRQMRRRKTGRWCKGRVGLSHDYRVTSVEAVDYLGVMFGMPTGGSIVELACANCGKKQMEIRMPEARS